MNQLTSAYDACLKKKTLICKVLHSVNIPTEASQISTITKPYPISVVIHPFLIEQTSSSEARLPFREVTDFLGVGEGKSFTLDTLINEMQEELELEIRTRVKIIKMENTTHQTMMS